MRKALIVSGILLCSIVLMSAGKGEINYSKSLTDPEGDVMDMDTLTFVSDKGEIDIISLSSQKSGTDIVFKFKVAGNIEDRENTIYTITINDLKYVITYENGSADYFSTEPYQSGSCVNSTSGDTLTIYVPENVFADATEWEFEGRASKEENGKEFFDDVMPGGNGEENIDPGTETPTNTAITVKIDALDFTYSKSDNKYKVDWSMSGTTTGDVHHCSITFVYYYDDGSKEVDEWTEGPFDYSGFFDVTCYFKGKNSDNDWSSWEFRYKFEGEILEQNDTFVPEEEGKELTKMIIYVRAYAPDGTWNQDSRTVTDFGTSDTENGKGFIPGFELLMLISTVVALAVIRKNLHSENPCIQQSCYSQSSHIFSLSNHLLNVEPNPS